MSRRIVSALTLVLVLATAVSAQAEGWGMPNLNPFSSGTKKTPSYRVNDGKSGSWLPSWGRPAPRSGPTTWQKVKAAPGSMMNKTKETLAPLNPWKATPKKTGSFMGTKKKDETTGIWPTWMTVEEKQEAGGPVSVSDWLNAPKPGDGQ